MISGYLSQFSCKLKKNSDEDEASGKDDVDIKNEKQLDALEAEVDGTGFDDEELGLNLDCNKDEIAGDVAASDALAVNEAILEADMSLRLNPHPLSSDQANVGCVSIAKVNIQ